MTRKALGRGLSALLSDAATSGEELLDVDLDLIDPNPDQPRSSINPARLEELAQSIRNNGLVQPILLRRVANGRFQVVAGERRWRAALLAGILRIPAVVRNIPDAKLLELALVENIQRLELNPIEEATAYQRLVDHLGLTQEELAERLGKQRPTVANYLRLLDLSDTIRRLLETGELSMGHARALLGLATAEQRESLANEIVKRRLSVREAERAVQQQSKKPRSHSSTVVTNDANIRAAELKMKRLLGTQVKIHLGREGGRIEVAFGSISELDRIYSIIMRKSETPAD
jgi:ParB family transcriptional regulator, chromosome partitioning protein